MGQSIADFLLGLLESFAVSKRVEAQVEVPVDVPPPSTDAKPPIDWTDPKCQVTDHFTVGEAITLHAWNRLADATDDLTDNTKASIVHLCQIMEEVRTILGCAINTHCIFRSVKYNQEVLKSLPNDVHSRGEAVDFDVNQTMTIDQAKEKLRPELERLGLRMEAGTKTWIHLDIHALGPSGREFTA